jgi:voltage-gated sodium channel
MTAPVFEPAVGAVIIANTGLVIAGLVIDGHEALFEAAHNGCLAFFVLELGLRLRVGGRAFFRSRWALFDAAVIAVSFMPALGVDASLLQLARAARLLHLVRHLTHLAPLLRLTPPEQKAA